MHGGESATVGDLSMKLAEVTAERDRLSALSRWQRQVFRQVLQHWMDEVGQVDRLAQWSADNRERTTKT